MPRKRVHLQIVDEISLVDNGANQDDSEEGSHVVLFKRADDPEGAGQGEGKGEPTVGPGRGTRTGPLRRALDRVNHLFEALKEAHGFDEALAQQDTDEEMWEAFRALRESLDSIADDDDVTDPVAMAREAVDEFAAHVAERLPEWLNQPVRIAAGSTEDNDMPEEQKKSLDDMTPEELRAELDKATEDLDETKAKLEASTEELDAAKAASAAGDAEAEGEDVLKGMDPEAADIVRKAQETANQAQQEAAALRAEAELAKASARASREFDHLPATADEIGKALVAMESIDADARATLEACLKGAEEAYRQVEAARGADGSGADDADGGLATLTARAKELCEKDATLSLEKAMTLAVEEDPSLYDAYKRAEA